MMIQRPSECFNLKNTQIKKTSNSSFFNNRKPWKLQICFHPKLGSKWLTVQSSIKAQLGFGKRKLQSRYILHIALTPKHYRKFMAFPVVGWPTLYYLFLAHQQFSLKCSIVQCTYILCILYVCSRKKRAPALIR